MKDILDGVTLEHLSAVSEEQRDIAEAIGLEAYRRLVEYAGGGFIYITQSKTLSRVLRDEEIRKDFDGSNYRELAQKYGLSTKHIRNITAAGPT